MQPSLLIGGLFALLTALALSRKWQLGASQVAVAVTVLAALSGLLVRIIPVVHSMGPVIEASSVWLLTMGASFALLAYRFYRDPERVPPRQSNVIVSPSDGVVIYVRNSRGGVLPVSTKNGHTYQLEELTKTALKDQDSVVVGIALSFLDVHVNRSPISGRVTLHRRFPGKFWSLRRPEAAFENERATTVIERDGLEIAIVQIASRLVRQIVSYIRTGEEVALGRRIGMIRFGSQVDLILPARPELRVVVVEGQRLTAGESVVAVVEQPSLTKAAAGQNRRDEPYAR